MYYFTNFFPNKEIAIPRGDRYAPVRRGVRQAHMQAQLVGEKWPLPTKPGEEWILQAILFLQFRMDQLVNGTVQIVRLLEVISSSRRWQGAGWPCIYHLANFMDKKITISCSRLITIKCLIIKNIYIYIYIYREREYCICAFCRVLSVCPRTNPLAMGACKSGTQPASVLCTL